MRSESAILAHGRTMKKLVFSLALIFVLVGCSKRHSPKVSASAVSATASIAPVNGPFSVHELQHFTALEPIDAHTHVFERSPAFYAMLKKLNLHILDILVDDDTIPEYAD